VSIIEKGGVIMTPGRVSVDGNTSIPWAHFLRILEALPLVAQDHGWFGASSPSSHCAMAVEEAKEIVTQILGGML